MFLHDEKQTAEPDPTPEPNPPVVEHPSITRHRAILERAHATGAPVLLRAEPRIGPLRVAIAFVLGLDGEHVRLGLGQMAVTRPITDLRYAALATVEIVAALAAKEIERVRA